MKIRFGIEKDKYDINHNDFNGFTCVPDKTSDVTNENMNITFKNVKHETITVQSKYIGCVDMEDVHEVDIPDNFIN